MGLGLSGSPAWAQIGSTYCVGAPNSTGAASTLTATGSLDVADDDVTLVAAGLPPGSVGYFLVAGERGSVPQVGGSQGSLCLGGPIGRYAANPLVAGAGGEVLLALQLANVPLPSQSFAVAAGESLHFQYWHRDVLASGGATSNLSSALTLTFCPGPLFSGGLSATRGWPRVLSLADLDADGDLDAVVSTGFDGELHLNRGGGEFAPRVPIPAIGGTADHGLGDLDGDGLLDLVTVSQNQLVTVRLGLGAAGFGPAATHPIPNALGLAHLALGDLEGDGDLDVVAAGPQAIATLVNDGAGGLAVQVVPVAVGQVSGLALGDLDGDGLQDLALTSGVLAVLRGLPGAAWAGATSHSAPPLALDPVLIDADQDGSLDVAAASQAGVVLWYGDGVGGLGPAVALDMGMAPLSALEVGDVDLDGIDELIVAGVSVVGLRRGLGGRTYGPPTMHPTSLEALDVALGDVDGDGRADLLATLNAGFGGGDLCLLNGDGTGRFDVSTATMVGNGPAALALADLDGDGVLDAVTANEFGSDLSILMGLGNGTFAPRVDLPVGVEPVALAVGDLDGDSLPDLVVVTRYAPWLSWLRNAGQGTFVPGGVLPGAAGTREVALADLDGDGDLDALTTQPFGETIVMYRNLGAGTFAALNPIQVGATPSGLALGDLDGDGDLDAAFGSESLATTASVRLLRNDGQGTFSVASLLATGELPTDVIVADLDGDGDADLATANAGTYDVSVLIQTGPGVFAPEVRLPADTDVLGIAVADIEGDGDIDLLATSRHGISFALFENNGLARFGGVTRFMSPRVVNGFALGDVDHDGDLDVVTVGPPRFFFTAPGFVVVTRNRCR